jgi:hypothetical protein
MLEAVLPMAAPTPAPAPISPPSEAPTVVPTYAPAAGPSVCARLGALGTSTLASCVVGVAGGGAPAACDGEDGLMLPVVVSSEPPTNCGARTSL